MAPISKQELDKYWYRLTPYEREEIKDFMDKGIYYLGLNVKKITTNVPHNRVTAALLDSTTGRYKIVYGDHIYYRYRLIEKLGKGSFGTVVSAVDHKDNKLVAIKIFRNKLGEDLDSELLPYEYVNRCCENSAEGLIQMIHFFKFRSHLCIVMPRCECDLQQFIARRRSNRLALSKIKIIVRSLLNALRQLHALDLYHGDLKEENIAILNNSTNTIKLIDYGDALFGPHTDKGRAHCMSYPAPEFLFRLPFGPAIDMWSVGSIVYQLVTRHILFKNERNHFDILIRYMEVLGLPPQDLIHKSYVKHEYFYSVNKPKYCYKKIQNKYRPQAIGRSSNGEPCALPGKIKKLKFSKTFPPKCADFIEKCLRWKPEQRLTPLAGLYHHWLRDKPNIRIKMPKHKQNPLKPGRSISHESVVHRKCNFKKRISISNSKYPTINGTLARTTSLVNLQDKEKDNSLTWLSVRGSHLMS